MQQIRRWRPRDEIAHDLHTAGIEVTTTPDLATARWRKLLWNIPFNGLTALLGVGTDELLKSASDRALVINIMEEVAAAARACGAPLFGADIAEMVQRTEAMVPYRTSMALDLDAGRPLEHDAIYGAPLRAAAAAGIATPRIEALYRAMDVLDQARLRRRRI